MLGMTLAHRLARAGHEVTLFEAADELGGLASPWTLGDVVWDRHYHVTLLSDPYLRGAARASWASSSEIEWVDHADRLLHRRTPRTRCRTASSSCASRRWASSTRLRLARHHPLRVAHPRLAAAGAHPRRGLAARAGRATRTFEKIWLPAAARQARRELPRHLGRVHLGDDRPHVRGAPHGAQEGDVRLRARRLRAHPGPLRARCCATRGYEVRLGQPTRRIEPVAKGRRPHAGERRERPVRPGRGDRARRTRARAVPRALPGRAGAPPRRALPGDRLRVGSPAQGPLSPLLRHEHHRALGALHRRHRDVGARGPRAPRGTRPRLPAQVRDTRDDPLFQTSDEEIRETFLDALARMYPTFDRSDVLAFASRGCATCSPSPPSATRTGCRPWRPPSPACTS